MTRSVQEIIKDIELVQEVINEKEIEVSLLKSKLTKLNIELAEK